MDSLGKTLGGCLLIALGSAGLLMTLCGGFFTIGLLPESLSNHTSEGGGYSRAGLGLAVPSLLFGILFAWLAFVGLTGNEKETSEPPPTPPADIPPADAAVGDEQSKKE